MNDNVQNTKAKIKSFRDLYAWQEGHKLVLQTYALTKKFPKDELFGIVNQMRRAAVSVTSNIAEGFSRKSYKEKSQFYSIAQGSVTELQNQFTISKDVTYITSKEFDETDAQSIRVHKILNGLIKSSKQFFLFALLLLPYSLLLIPYSASASTLTKPVNNLGLVGYWKFDEGTTTQAGDSSGHRNTGTLSGGTWVSGKLGKALSFNGTSDKVTGGPFTVGTTMTISAWVYKNTSTSQRSFFSNRSGSGHVYFGLSGTQIFLYDNAATPASFTSSSGVAQIGKWQHIVATSDGSTTTFYINGAFVTSISQTRTASTGTSFGIGWDPSIGTEYWDGKIDDVRVYSRALSAAEVLNLYQYGGAGAVNHSSNLVVPNGLVGMWSFDNGDMTWKSGITGTAYDRSGNGNNGTLTNMNQSTSPTIGKIGQALRFNGSSSYVNVGNNASLDFSGKSFAISAWINSKDATTNGSIYDAWQSPWAFRLYTGSGTIAFQLRNTAGIDIVSGGVSTAISNNTWYHVVALYNYVNSTTGTVYLYINGSLATSANCSAASCLLMDNTGSVPQLIGKKGDGANYFSGSIDDLRVYNRALSAAEIKQIYLAGAAAVNHSTNLGLNSGLTGLWSFDGRDTNWGTNKETDGSGNGNTGTLISMSTTTSPTIGKIGQALKFTAAETSGTVTTGYVTVGNLQTFNKTAFTISAWFKTNFVTPAGSGGELYTDGAGGTYGEFFIGPGGVIGADTPNWNFTTTGTNYSDGKWHLATLTQSSLSSRTLYVDGAPQATNTTTMSNITYTNSTIGTLIRSVPQYGYNGALDDVRTYSRALSATEVKQLYNLGK